MKRSELKNFILKLIVQEYVSNAKPVGSVFLISKYKLDVSSATVRNIMAELENELLIEKSHTSSGRIPTNHGYEFYAKYLSNDFDQQLSSKIKDIFAKRRSSIDNVVDEAVSIISEISKLTVVTSEITTDELLKSISLTPISETSAIVVVITSSGKVDSKEIRLTNNLKINDLKIAIRIFQERLYDIKLVDIPSTIKNIEPILRENIKNYEELIEAFVNNIFTSYVNVAKNKVYGKSYIIQSNDIEREQLAHLINLIENQSIWESINDKYYLDDNLKLEILPNNTTLISKRLNINGNIKDVSVVGPMRMDYSQAKNILNIIEKHVKSMTNESE